MCPYPCSYICPCISPNVCPCTWLARTCVCTGQLQTCSSGAMNMARGPRTTPPTEAAPTSSSCSILRCARVPTSSVRMCLCLRLRELSLFVCVCSRCAASMSSRDWVCVAIAGARHVPAARVPCCCSRPHVTCDVWRPHTHIRVQTWQRTAPPTSRAAS